MLQRLQAGESVRSGEVQTVQQKDVMRFLTERHGVDYRRVTKSRGLYTVTDKDRFKEGCFQYDRSLDNLDNALALAEGHITTRAQKTNAFGNSKQGRKGRTLKGFTILATQDVKVRYLGFDYAIGPLAGLHIIDRHKLKIPDDMAILIVENAECLYDHNWIKNVGIDEEEGPFLLMFRSHIPEEGKLWLESISNRILYFGDFDLGGIRTYETEYKRRLGDRITFIVPEDLEQRIRTHGNPDLYKDQIKNGFAHLVSASGELTGLINLIHRLQNTYEQEGYILKID